MILLLVSEKGNAAACKESSVRQPGAGGFCYIIGLVNSVFNLPNAQVMFFEEFEWQSNCEINSARQKAFGASWNDIWASKCKLQLAWMASCKNDFLCTLCWLTQFE